MIEITEADGTVREYNLTVSFGAEAYTPVVASLRATYEIDGDTITVNANEGVSNVYLQIGKYYGEKLSIVEADETDASNGAYNVKDENAKYVVKQIEAKGWRVYSSKTPVEFDMIYDASSNGGDVVTRHFVINF